MFFELHRKQEKRTPFSKMFCEENSIFSITSVQSIKSLRFSNDLNSVGSPLLKMTDVCSNAASYCI